MTDSSSVQRKSVYSLTSSFFDRVYTTSETDDGKHAVLCDAASRKKFIIWKALVSEPKKKELLFVSNRELYLHANDRPAQSAKLTDVEKLGQMHKIIIIMSHGGYFSAAVFVDGRCVCHKSFHRYVTRRKQGGRQSKRDASGRCRSAGAQIRRHNEEKHQEEVHQLLAGWKEHIDSCDLIFVHLPGKNKVSVLEGSAVAKDDARLRTIPFTVHRPKTQEVKRVYDQLVTVSIVDGQVDIDQIDLTAFADVIVSSEDRSTGSDDNNSTDDDEQANSDEEDSE